MTNGPVVETHVSVLIFLDDVVVKFKKPVRFPFVDLTSRDSRLRACEAEVRYNSRLSSDVYLGVANLSLGGEALDHAVVLRRLPADRSLAEMATRQDPGLDRGLQKLAELLVDFHANAERSAEISADASPRAIASLWGRCFDTLRTSGAGILDPELLEEAELLANRFIEGRGPLFAERISNRKICDGHGDLLASDVFLLEDGPRILDCVEFDPKLRHVDVIADTAFLAMDLEYLGAPGAALRFVDYYEKAAADRFPASLLDHYCAQRALVRSEVACLRVGQGVSEETEAATKLLRLALDHLRRGRVVLGVLCGSPGTGKSTLAEAASDRLGWPVLRSDEIRRELVGPGTARLVADFETGPYTDEISGQVYDLLMCRAQDLVRSGQSVLLDATFHDSRFQRRLERLAEVTATDLVVLRCATSEGVARARVRSRELDSSSISGANEDIASRLAASFAPWPDAVTIDTGSQETAMCLDQVLKHLVRT